ncbi:hypothetical protein GCM10023205_82730 [Yinghuangia aomiensis]|uniref:Uncharacterized protein n=1 Tax=Yinghuangia aomiensis TaxID=676205 RepID=A0ABP9IFP3_9ACTN
MPELRGLRDGWLFPSGACTGWFRFRYPSPDGGCSAPPSAASRASIVRRPAEEMRTFIDNTAAALGELPDAIASSGQQLSLELRLMSTVDKRVISDFNKQFRRGWGSRRSN